MGSEAEAKARLAGLMWEGIRKEWRSDRTLTRTKLKCTAACT